MRYPAKLLRTILTVGMSLLLLPVLVTPVVAQTWIELAPTGPQPPDPVFAPKRAFYDAANNRLIAFFPGHPPYNPDPPGNGNDVWVLTNANGLGGTPTWVQLQPTGAPPISNGLESVVYDAANNRLIVYGGCYANCSPALSQVFVLSNANGLGGIPVWTQSSVTNPQPRDGHTAVYDPVNNLMIAFGGNLAFFGTDHNDTRLLTDADAAPSTWITLSTSGGPPPVRMFHTAIYDQATNRMVIYGGHNYQKNYCCGFPYGNMVDAYGDLWVLTHANGVGGPPTWVQQTPSGPTPPSRGGHSAVYDSANNRMLVLGGSSVVDFTTQTFTTLGDLWELSNANGLSGTPTWTQLAPLGTPPAPRVYHAAAFDSANQRMILLGGRNDADTPPTSNRVWVLIFSQTVDIDIKPGSEPNSINLSSAGVIPVAILSSDTFDARTVDPETVSLAGASVKMVGKSGKFLCHEEDVNSDGLLDLVCKVYTEQFMIEEGQSVAVLEAETFDGISIRGEDFVRIVPDQ